MSINLFTQVVMMALWLHGTLKQGTLSSICMKWIQPAHQNQETTFLNQNQLIV